MSQIPASNHFAVLGLSIDADDAQIREAYRKLTNECQGDAERLRQIAKAYATLANPISRKIYRQQLLSAPAQPAATPGTPSQSETPTPRPGAGRPPTTPTIPTVPTGKREGTEIYDPTAGQRAQPRQHIEPPASALGRQKTVFVEPGRQPERQEPKPSTPAQGGRQKTVFVEPGQEAVRQEREAPSTGAGGRKSTVLVDTGAGVQKEPEKPLDTGAGGRKITVLVGQKGALPAPGGPRQPTDTGEERASQPAASPVPPQDAPAAKPPEAEQERSAGVSATREREDTVLHQSPAEPASMARIELRYQGQTQTFHLRAGENVIGRPAKRSDLPQIPLEDAEQFVSRLHAVIVLNGPVCSIVDRSRNGTYLNGQLLTPQLTRQLKDGDVIKIEGRELVVKLGTGD